MLRHRFSDALQRAGLPEQSVPALARYISFCTKCPSITKIDHITFVCAPSERSSFIDRWLGSGFEHHGTWKTERYAASHTALIRGSTPQYPWTEMIGLSTATGENRPLECEVDPSIVDQAQHVAFNVDAAADADTLYAEQSAAGFDMMTRILNYRNDDGAGLRQWFTKPIDGFFVEFVQRLPSADGVPYSGFDPTTIDDLYTALDANLIEKQR